MFEQDYIMRQIQQISRALAKILFNIDAEILSSAIIKDVKAREAADDLIQKTDNGNINEAENKLFALTTDRTLDNLLVGIVFYSHLNEKDDDELEKNDFSHDKIKNGLTHLLSEYGLEAMADLFL